MSKKWKPTKTTHPNFRCKRCGSNEILYREDDKDYGVGIDYEYKCLNCHRYWCVDGSDY